MRKWRTWWINIFSNVVFTEDISGISGLALRMDPEIINVVEVDAVRELVEALELAESVIRQHEMMLAEKGVRVPVRADFMKVLARLPKELRE